mgnify:CR=1 FL=1
MGATSLFEVRAAFQDLFYAQLSGIGVELLEAVPRTAEDIQGRQAWWSNEIDVAAEPWTTSGVVERYELALVVTALPEDGDVSVVDAQEAVSEVVDLLFAVVQANRRPLDGTGSEWSAVAQWAGFSHMAQRTNVPPGVAADVAVRIGVEATRCN